MLKKAHDHDKDLIDWLRLSRTPYIGPITFKKCIESFGTATNALEALPELSKRGGRKKPLTPPSISSIEQELEKLFKAGGHILTWEDDDFPAQLKIIEDAPTTLSYFGSLTPLTSQNIIAIVGARNASLNGQKFTKKLAAELGQNGHIIASGLARGIDTAAHEGSVETGTIAILAGGIDVIYPRENQKLYEEIIEKNSIIIGESALGTQPTARHFPKRNRIISGLSQAVIVVEAATRSGSLITARTALEQGRDVMAVPGYPNDPRAQGPNKLIREGAILIRNAKDVLSDINDFDQFLTPKHDLFSTQINESPQESFDHIEELSDLILDRLSAQAISIDELAREIDRPISSLNASLLALELAGQIERLPGNRVARLMEVG